MSGPDGWRCEFSPPKRSGSQNDMLHALLGEIAARQAWAGKMRSTEVWKRLTTAAWLRARGDSVEVLPALDGHGVDLVYTPTSSLSKAECAELLDFVTAWAAEAGVFEETT
jgi:hypothetical protein